MKKMKMVLMVLMVATALMFVGCGNDDTLENQEQLNQGQQTVEQNQDSGMEQEDVGLPNEDEQNASLENG